MTDQTPNTSPTYTVSGNHMRVFRLDAEGNPTGAAIDFPGPVTFGIAADEVEDVRIDWPTETVTIEMEMQHVDPAVLALLTGQGKVPEEITVLDIRTRWQRFVDNHPRLCRWFR